jgi:hypothetical protein
MSNLDIIDQILDPVSLQAQIQKDLAERRALIIQFEQMVDKNRAAEQQMQTARRIAAEDVVKAETLTNEANELMETAQKNRTDALSLLAENKQKEIDLNEREHQLNEREKLIDQKQTKYTYHLNQIRTLVN